MNSLKGKTKYLTDLERPEIRKGRKPGKAENPERPKIGKVSEGEKRHLPKGSIADQFDGFIILFGWKSYSLTVFQ